MTKTSATLLLIACLSIAIAQVASRHEHNEHAKHHHGHHGVKHHGHHHHENKHHHHQGKHHEGHHHHARHHGQHHHVKHHEGKHHQQRDDSLMFQSPQAGPLGSSVGAGIRPYQDGSAMGLVGTGSFRPTNMSEVYGNAGAGFDGSNIFNLNKIGNQNTGPILPGIMVNGEKDNTTNVHMGAGILGTGGTFSQGIKMQPDHIKYRPQVGASILGTGVSGGGHIDSKTNESGHFFNTGINGALGPFVGGLNWGFNIKVPQSNKTNQTTGGFFRPMTNFLMPFYRPRPIFILPRPNPPPPTPAPKDSDEEGWPFESVESSEEDGDINVVNNVPNYAQFFNQGGFNGMRPNPGYGYPYPYPGQYPGQMPYPKPYPQPQPPRSTQKPAVLPQKPGELEAWRPKPVETVTDDHDCTTSESPVNSTGLARNAEENIMASQNKHHAKKHGHHKRFHHMKIHHEKSNPGKYHHLKHHAKHHGKHHVKHHHARHHAKHHHARHHGKHHGKHHHARHHGKHHHGKHHHARHHGKHHHAKHHGHHAKHHHAKNHHGHHHE